MLLLPSESLSAFNRNSCPQSSDDLAHKLERKRAQIADILADPVPAMSRKLSRMMGDDVTAVNEAGSAFTVRLPRPAPQADQPGPPRSHAGEGALSRNPRPEFFDLKS